MKKIFFISLFILSCWTFSKAQEELPKKYEFEGVLKTKKSEIIAGANLYFKKDGRTNVVSTDLNGKFRTQLLAGNYEITLNNALSKSFKAFIKIVGGKINPEKIAFSIEPPQNACGLSEKEVCPKPVKIVKAIFPAAAVAIRASGEVVVRVKIDEQGKVFETKAINGHPLLRRAAERAAFDSVFEETKGKSDGIFLTYVFLHSINNPENAAKYKNPYRIEMESPKAVVNY